MTEQEKTILQSALIAAYDKAFAENADPEDRDTYVMMIVEHLRPAVYQEMKKRGMFNPGWDSENITAMITEKIVFAIINPDPAARYNPRQAAPSTIFQWIIKGAIGRIRENATNIPQYYSATIRNLNNVLKKLGYAEGLQSPDLTPERIAALTDQPVKTVVNCLQYVNVNVCSIDAVAEETSTAYDTPEEAMLKSEASEEIASAMKRLNPYQQYIVNQTAIEERSITSLVKEFSEMASEQLFEVYGLFTAPTEHRVKEDLSIAIALLRNSPELDHYRKPFRKTRLFDIHAMQASNKEIDQAVLAGLFEEAAN